MATSSVVSVVQWIGSLLIQEARPLLNLEEDVQGLKDELEFMQQYLQDADARQEEKEIHASVRQIRKLAYDAEDVIDTYILKVQHSNDHSRVVEFGGFIYNFPRLYRVREKIQVIQTSLKRIYDKLNTFGVRKDTQMVSLKRQRPPSCPFDDNDDKFVVGLEKNLPNLLEVLTSEGNTHKKIISIVGMGGSGKTTLARKLYNHPYIRECFNCTAWVSVSQEWSTLHVLSEILREVGGPEINSGSNNLSVPELVSKVRNALWKKSYLVILDDVWKREALQEILPALPMGNVRGGTKIIITTRNRDAIQCQNLQQNMYIFEPPPLSHEEGWELFHKIALSHSRRSNEASFVNLGKEMLEKCDGLPLAIVALAGILNMKDSIAEWNQVNEAVRSRVMDGIVTHTYGRVGDMLTLSYNDLPYYLKPCFLYLSLFPEDYKIPAGMLTRMWIAEGLVSAPKDISIEDAATQNLEELSHRFMIQVVRTNFMGVIKTVSLHDLLRDVCLKEAEELSFLQVYPPFNEAGSTDTPVFAIQPRRAALHSCASFPAQLSYLRSLVLLTCSKTPESTHIYEETLDLMIVPQRYKLLRLLTLRNISTVNGCLPTQIGSLLHLRYLEIRGTNITQLPKSIGKLRSLLVLDYREVVSGDEQQIIKIPNVLWKLVLLRHLFLPINCPWSVQELKLSTMTSLQTLWGVKQDKAGSKWLSKEITELCSSVKKLKIVVSSRDELESAFSNPSLKSDGLQTFHCELTNGIPISNVEPLSHRKRLHKLILIGQVEMKLSLIMPTNLVTLKLKDSVLKDEDPMAVLGELPHLKLISLSNAFVGSTLVCNNCSFPQLEELYLENLVHWELWKIDKGAMQCLKKLEITSCLSLKQFPRNLKYVTTLQEFNYQFDDIPDSFSKEAAECGWSPSHRLPSNFGAIIIQADLPVDTSSIRKLHEQLTAGIFLNNKSQKYWIVERQNIYHNCFMVYATNLCPKPTHIENEPSLEWKLFPLFPGSCSKDGTMSQVKAAELNCSDVHVFGEFNTASLLSSVTYEVVWLVMLSGFEMHLFVDELDFHLDYNSTIVQTEIFLRDATLVSSKKKKTFDNRKPLNQWERVPGGEFTTSLTIHCDKETIIRVALGYTQHRHTTTRLPSLAVQGFIVQPKDVQAS